MSIHLLWKAIKKGDLSQVSDMLDARHRPERNRDLQNAENSALQEEQPSGSREARCHSDTILLGGLESGSALVHETLVHAALNKYGWTALHAACYFGHIEIVEYLVHKQKADVNFTAVNGRNSLIFAVYGGHIDVVDFLLYETSVNWELRESRNNRTAWEIAEHLEDREMTDLFQEWHAFKTGGSDSPTYSLGKSSEHSLLLL
jgi:ankyrin repeat protein